MCNRVETVARERLGRPAPPSIEPARGSRARAVPGIAWLRGGARKPLEELSVRAADLVGFRAVLGGGPGFGGVPERTDDNEQADHPDLLQNVPQIENT